MMLGSYRKRLEADLVNWTHAGLIQPTQASAIRRAVEAQGGVKLPGVLGMLGALLLAAAMIAFVAANWEAIPRLVKLGGILAGIVAALGASWHFGRAGSPRTADAAATLATLVFGAGVALVGQMYHLPADWPAGALLVGIGALVAAALMRSDGALIIAFAAGAGWLFASYSEGAGVLGPLATISWTSTPWYLAFWLPAFALAMGRTKRPVHHAAVLALGVWLVLAAGNPLGSRMFGSLLAFWLAIAIASIAVGHLASDRGWAPVFTAFLPWGLLGYVVTLAAQLSRVFERGALSGNATLPVVLAGLAALAGIAALFRLPHERRSGALLGIALALAAAIPLIFWSGFGFTGPGRIAVAALLLASSCMMVAAGTASGIRRVSLAGTASFGLNVLVLLYTTIGTLLGQSLFFLIGGILLIVLAIYAPKLLARVAPTPTERAP